VRGTARHEHQRRLARGYGHLIGIQADGGCFGGKTAQGGGEQGDEEAEVPGVGSHDELKLAYLDDELKIGSPQFF